MIVNAYLKYAFSRVIAISLYSLDFLFLTKNKMILWPHPNWNACYNYLWNKGNQQRKYWYSVIYTRKIYKCSNTVTFTYCSSQSHLVLQCKRWKNQKYTHSVTSLTSNKCTVELLRISSTSATGTLHLSGIVARIVRSLRLISWWIICSNLLLNNSILPISSTTITGNRAGSA